MPIVKCNYQINMKNYQKISIATLLIGAVAIFSFVIANNYKTETSFKHETKNVSNAKAEKAQEEPQDAVAAAVNKATEKPVPNYPESEILKVSSSDIVYGDKNAPVVMIEYSSLSCPHCAAFNREAFDRIKSEYIETNQVKFIHRDFPLNQPALAASMFAICESNNDSEKYYTLIKALFKTQDSWAFDKNFLEKLQSIAQLDGMSAEKFKSCVNDQNLQDRILKDRLDASKNLKIQATPTFFINGEISEGYVDYVSIKKIIDAKLAETK